MLNILNFSGASTCLVEESNTHIMNASFVSRVFLVELHPHPFAGMPKPWVPINLHPLVQCFGRARANPHL